MIGFIQLGELIIKISHTSHAFLLVMNLVWIVIFLYIQKEIFTKNLHSNNTIRYTDAFIFLEDQ